MSYFSVLRLWHTYADSHPSKSSKKDTLAAKKWWYFVENALLKLNFQHDGHLHANCLIYIVTISFKCLVFQFLDCGIRVQIPVLTEVQIGRIICRKKCSYFDKKNVLFDAYFPRLMTLVCQFLLLHSNFFFCKYFLFHFFNHDIRMHISILTEVQKGHNSG